MREIRVWVGVKGLVGEMGGDVASVRLRERTGWPLTRIRGRGSVPHHRLAFASQQWWWGAGGTRESGGAG